LNAEDLSKLDVSPNGDSLFVSGMDGTSKFKVQNEVITPLYRKDSIFG
jgi:hypothetical protein